MYWLENNLDPPVWRPSKWALALGVLVWLLILWGLL